MGGWFLTETIVLSGSKGIVHPYYVSALAPATGAMVGGGAVALARLRRGSWPLWGTLLAAFAVIGTVAVQVVLLHREHYMLWLVPCARRGRRARPRSCFSLSRRLAAPALALTLVLLLVAPTAIRRDHAGSRRSRGPSRRRGRKRQPAAAATGSARKSLAIDKPLLAYVRSHHPGRRWALFTVAVGRGRAVHPAGPQRGQRSAATAAPTRRIDGAGPRAAGGAAAKPATCCSAASSRSRGGNRATDGGAAQLQAAAAEQWHSPIPIHGRPRAVRLRRARARAARRV